ncbi:MAG: hypothetical protein FJY97_12375 [candidate division Zixibacteria bacterium]|nr:hypothetical protein [candidate division Zixibacteria bacterium]
MPTYAQTSVNTPASDPVYQALDVLAGHGLADDMIYGQRPYSRREIARLLTRAQRLWTEQSIAYRNAKPGIDVLLERFIREYQDEAEQTPDKRRFRISHGYRMTGYLASSTYRPVPRDNRLGEIDAVIGSFDAYNEGRALARGASVFLTSSHSFHLSRHASVWLEPQIAVNGWNPGPLRLYLTAGWKNIAFQIGRDQLLWGQGSHGGILFSSHARPLDMIKLHNPYPFRFPSIFGVFGPTRITFFVANLGSGSHPRYAFVYGAKASFKPSRYVEVAFSHAIMMGGDGAPGVSFFEPLTELFPVHKLFRNLQVTDIANHEFGLFELCLTLPRLRHAVVYGEGVFEDSPARGLSFPDNLLNQMSFQTGLYLPRLTDSGSMSLRFDHRHIAPWAYRHHRWTTGFTLNRRLLGSPLGPAADGFSMIWGWRRSETIQTMLNGAYETYRPDLYTQTPNKYGGSDRVIKAVDLPDEVRLRLTGTVDWRPITHWAFLVQTGVERVRRFGFVEGNDRVHGMAGLQVTRVMSR